MSFKEKLRSNSKKAVHILLVIVFIVLSLFLTVATYARYFTGKTVVGGSGVAKWKVALKQNSRPLSTSFNVNLIAVGSEHISPDKFAPSATLQATFVLDITGTEVAVDYKITANTDIFGGKIGSGDITLAVYCNGNAVSLGKETFIPLDNGGKFTETNGVYEFKFILTWAAYGDNASDVEIAANNTVVSLPVSIELKQHTRNENYRNAQSGAPHAEADDCKQTVFPSVKRRNDRGGRK